MTMNIEELIKDYKKLLEKHGISSVAVVQSRKKKAGATAAVECPEGQKKVRVVGPDGKVTYVCM